MDFQLTPGADSAGAGAAIGLPVAFQEVSKRYGETRAVERVSLEVAAGEFLSLLGPSGSGKTTLLMMLAGFEVPSAGRLLVGGRDITRLPANRREIGMVFQRYALFPHMTVAQNVAFPLRMRGRPATERTVRVARALEMVQLGGLAERVPGQLSGGQQQRVALARALVFDPPVLLMDEPLGALDRKLRQHMQLELKQLQARLGATVIYVTHDQDEALAMSDRIAVLHGGRIEQIDAPRRLYEHPANLFVADFMGELNRFDGIAAGGESPEAGVLAVNVEGQRLLATLPAGAVAPAAGNAVVIGVRPEHLRLTPAAAATPGLPGQVLRTVFNGASITIHVTLASGRPVQAIASPQAGAADLQPGDPVLVGWATAQAAAFAASA